MNDGQGGAPAIRPPGDERGSTPCRLGHLSAVPAPAGFPAPGRGVPGIFTPPKAECQTKYKHGPRTEECPVAVCSVRLGRCVPADDRLRGAGTCELPEGAGGGLGPLELPTFADQPLPRMRVEGRLRPALPQRRGWRSRLEVPAAGPPQGLLSKASLSAAAWPPSLGLRSPRVFFCSSEV